MDNGKIRLQQLDRALICEAYTSGELTLDDIEWVFNKLKKNFSPPYLLIIVRKGNYTLSSQAKLRIFIEKHKDLKVAYIVRRPMNLFHANNAKDTYLKGKQVFFCDGIKSAYKVLVSYI
jgi:hypothetical protein